MLVIVLCFLAGFADPAAAGRKKPQKVSSQVRIQKITDSEISGVVRSPRAACERGRQVLIEINGEEIGTIEADDDGRWITEVTVEDEDVVRATIEKLIVGRKGKKAVCRSDSDTEKANIPEPTVHEVLVAVTGDGAVNSDPNGINNCRASSGVCVADFNRDSQVTLTATADTGQQFTGWGGDCTGTQSTCTLTMDSGKEVSAAFAPSGGPPEPDTCPVPTEVPEALRGVLCLVAETVAGLLG